MFFYLYEKPTIYLEPGLSDPFYYRHICPSYSLDKKPLISFVQLSLFFTAVWRSLALKHVFSTDFRLIYTPSCNFHCQPFVTASIPYFLFLICYALPPTTVRNHKIDKRNLDGILSYYKLTIIVNHIDFFLSFCILKIKLKNIRTLCIFTTKVELFVLFLSCWISGLPRCLVSYYYNFIF